MLQVCECDTETRTHTSCQSESIAIKEPSGSIKGERTVLVGAKDEYGYI